MFVDLILFIKLKQLKRTGDFK